VKKGRGGIMIYKISREKKPLNLGFYFYVLQVSQFLMTLQGYFGLPCTTLKTKKLRARQYKKPNLSKIVCLKQGQSVANYFIIIEERFA
jgi:hypothetical protein